MNTQIEQKPIDSICIHAKEWFDRANGNSYFSATIQINGEVIHKLPFQYGYGESYIDAANQWLVMTGIIDNPRHDNGSYNPLWSYCQDNGITLYTQKADKCLQREL